MGEKLKVYENEKGQRKYYSETTKKTYDDLEVAKADIRSKRTQPLEYATSQAETIRAATPFEKVDNFLGQMLNPIRMFRPAATFGGAATGMGAVAPAAATMGPYGGAATLAAGGMLGGLAANMAAQSAQQGAPEYLGPAGENPLQTAAYETLFDRITSAIPGALSPWRDTLKKKFIGTFAPSTRSEAEKAAMNWAQKQGMEFDVAQTTGSKAAEVLESLAAHKKATELRTKQGQQLGKMVDRQIADAYNASGNPNLRPNVNIRTLPETFSKRSGVPYAEFERMLNLNAPNPEVLDNYLARIKGFGNRVPGGGDATSAYLSQIAAETKYPYERLVADVKGRFLQKAFEAVQSENPVADAKMWSGANLIKLLDENRSLVNRLFKSSDERAALNHIAHVMKIVDPKLSIAGKTALGIRMGGAALSVGAGIIDVLTGGNVGTAFKTGGALLLTASGGSAMLRKLLLNPRNAKLAGDLMMSPADGKYVANKTRNLLRGLKGTQFLIQTSTGDPIGEATVDDNGNLAMKVPTASSQQQ